MLMPMKYRRMVSSIVGHQLLAWEGLFERKVESRVFRAILRAIFGILWIGRNMKVFDGVETSPEQLKDKCLKTLFFWNEEVFVSSLFDMVDFVDSYFLGVVISLL